MNTIKNLLVKFYMRLKPKLKNQLPKTEKLATTSWKPSSKGAPTT